MTTEIKNMLEVKKYYKLEAIILLKSKTKGLSV